MSIFCCHTWRAVSVFHGNRQDGYEMQPVTFILYRCRKAFCGKVMTERIDGHWTFDEIDGTEMPGVTRLEK